MTVGDTVIRGPRPDESPRLWLCFVRETLEELHAELGREAAEASEEHGFDSWECQDAADRQRGVHVALDYVYAVMRSYDACEASPYNKYGGN